MCCYFPSNNNHDKLAVLQNLVNDIRSLELTCEVVIAGDFNFSLNKDIDQSNTTRSYPEEKNLRELNTVLGDDFGLYDTLRFLEPTASVQTNHPYGEQNARRLDRIYISEGFKELLHQYIQDEHAFISSTHDYIMISIVQTSSSKQVAKKRFRVPMDLVHDPDFEKSVKLAGIDSWTQYVRYVKGYSIIHRQTTERDMTSSPNIMKIMHDRVKKTTSITTTITKLYNTQGELVTTTDDLLAVSHDFYSNLYDTKRIKPHNSYLKLINKSINEDDKIMLDQVVNIDEMKTAIESMKESAPGEDGIPLSLIVNHWSIVGPLLVKEMNQIMNNQPIPNSINKILLVLIKKSGDGNLMENYRPISLTNYSDRIMSKVMSIRLLKVLDHLLPSSMHGFVGKRTLEECVAKYNHLLRRVEEDKNYALLNIDFKKAFDNLNVMFVVAVLRKLNFGEKFITFFWRSLVDKRGTVFLNNKKSEEFQFKKGVRQGSALSPFIFLISLSVLMIHLDSVLTGFEFDLGNGIKTKVTCLSFADDLTVVVNADDIQYFKHILRKFRKNSQLEINKAKSTIITKDHEKFSLLGYEKLDFTSKNFYYLGVPMNCLSTSKFVAEIRSSIRGLGVFQVTMSYKVQAINNYILTKLKSRDQAYGFSYGQLHRIKLEIFSILGGVANEKLQTLVLKGGFSLENHIDTIDMHRAIFIYNILFCEDPENWPIFVARVQLQKAIDKEEGTVGGRIPWYVYLCSKKTYTTKIRKTDKLDLHYRLCLEAWFRLALPLLQDMELTRQNYILMDENTPRLLEVPGGVEYFKRWRRQRGNEFGEIIISESWNTVNALTPEIMKKLYKKVTEIGKSNVLISDVIRRFYIGHDNHHQVNTMICSRCNTNLGMQELGYEHRKPVMLRHRYINCPTSSKLWTAFGPLGYDLTIGNLFNTEMLVENLVLVSRYVSAVHALEKEMINSSEILTEAQVEEWCVSYEKKYRRLYNYP